ncbi:MAG TPA: diguanylate cyclase [Longimicrobiales bacterium]
MENRLHWSRWTATRGLAVAGIWVTTAVGMWVAGASPVVWMVVAAGAIAVALVRVPSQESVLDGAAELGRRLAGTDSATDLASPVRAGHFLTAELAAAQRGRRVTLVLFGFDHFDEFVRTHGRRETDRAVRKFGRVLTRMTRKMNLSARYGWRADTFLSVLSDADATGAAVFVERVKQALAEDEHEGRMPAISAGVVEFHPDFTAPAQFVDAVEETLAEARAAGGDCVRFRRAPLQMAGRPLLRAL